MAGVFESYEHQFSTITADITARIGRIPNLVGSEWVWPTQSLPVTWFTSVVV